MQRRDFLKAVGAASLAPAALEAGRQSAPRSPAATVLYDDRAVALDRVAPPRCAPPAPLWVRKRDLPRINGFDLKPQGACRADLCIPIPKDMLRREYFNLTAFAKKAGQQVVAEPAARVWSFGEMQALGGGLANSRVAPDYVLSDEEFARRVKPRSSAEMEAEASFKLAVWFLQAGNAELAQKYFERAQMLNPDDWNYHRQEWSFTGEAGKKWLEKFKGFDKEYYPKLQLKPKG